MVPVPDSGELFAAARNPSLPPDPEIRIVWPLAIWLSGWAEGTFAQVKGRPSAVTAPHGVSPAAARPWVEKVVPIPSKPWKPGEGLVLVTSVVPALSNVDARLGAGTLSCAVLIKVVLPPWPRESPPLKLAVASRPTSPGVRPEDGAVTWKVAEAEPPGATVPSDCGVDGEVVQPPGGAVSATEAPRSGASVGWVSVAFTETGPSASADDGIAASVGCGLAAGPYTSDE